MSAARGGVVARGITWLMAAAMFAATALACTAVVSDGDYKVGSACNQTPTDGPCAQCLKTTCCGTESACKDDTSCRALDSCLGACASGDNPCIDTCGNRYPSSVATWLAYAKCETSNCKVCFSSKAGLGDPCTQNSDCASAACLGDSTNPGWCSQTCVHDTECGGTNKFGQQNACIRTKFKPMGAPDFVKECFPGCSGDSDCSSFAGTTCGSGPSNDGAIVSVCSVPSATDGGPPPSDGSPPRG